LLVNSDDDERSTGWCLSTPSGATVSDALLLLKLLTATDAIMMGGAKVDQQPTPPHQRPDDASLLHRDTKLTAKDGGGRETAQISEVYWCRQMMPDLDT
jgi:hypothetical protein